MGRASYSDPKKVKALNDRLNLQFIAQTAAARILYPKQFIEYRKEYQGGPFNGAAWLRAGGGQQQIDKIKAQSGNTPVVVRIRISTEDRKRFDSISPTVKQSASVQTQKNGKQSGPRQSQDIWLTEAEEIAQIKENGWKCWGCGSEYGTWTAVENGYDKVSPVQMHVTRTRKMGGKKTDVREGCSTCNRIHGRGKGMSESEFRIMIAKERKTRGYRNVVKLIEG